MLGCEEHRPVEREDGYLSEEGRLLFIDFFKINDDNADYINDHHYTYAGHYSDDNENDDV